MFGVQQGEAVWKYHCRQSEVRAQPYGTLASEMTTCMSILMVSTPKYLCRNRGIPRTIPNEGRRIKKPLQLQDSANSPMKDDVSIELEAA